MEKSIKRVEKLVHATSSTLAQMKFSLMFDDLNGGKTGQGAGRKLENFDATLWDKLDDLNLRQNEFDMEASETLAKMDKILGPNEFSRKNQKPLERIKEINKKMNHLKLEQSKRGETKQSRQKLLSLINEEKFSPGMTSCKESVGSKQTARFIEEKEPSDKIRTLSRKTESVSTPIIHKAELKNRILETQEIVDRGFQTARLLAQKVESMTKLDRKDRTPSTGKTVSEINLRSLDGKTESNETIKTVKCRRCERKKKREGDFRGEIINNRVIDMRRHEWDEKGMRSNLQLQQLPSLNIRGGLKVQKIHNLEIPASGEVPSEKNNTAVSFLSHEQMEREKIEKVKKENCIFMEYENRTKYIECFNCGKLIRIQGTWVDPKKVDEVLRKCDFNVFDPKIDEFVEKYATVDARCEDFRTTAVMINPYEDIRPTALTQTDDFIVPVKSEEISPQIKETKEKKRFTLQDLSDQLCKKYKQEADALADNHLKLDNILRNLFRKVEESKEVFEGCSLMRNHKVESDKTTTLTKTKPVLVNLPTVSLAKYKQKKLDKKDVKNRSKSRTEFSDESPTTSVGEEEGIRQLVHSNQKTEAKERQKSYYATCKSVKNKEGVDLPTGASPSNLSSSKSEQKIRKTLMMASVQRKESISKSKAKSTSDADGTSSITSSTSSSKGGATCDLVPPKPAQTYPAQFSFIKPGVINMENNVSPSKSSNGDKEEEELAAASPTASEKSENNYESDFESVTNEPDEKEPEVSPEMKKLSTITEVDSEVEKKFSDDQKAKDGKLSQKEDNSGISVKSKKTEDGSIKSAPTELVTSLKDILTALKDQFARTESLAEKLTESSRVEKKEKPEITSPVLNPWDMTTPEKLVENLKSLRKDWSPRPKSKFTLTLTERPTKNIPERISYEEGVSQEGGSSLGEIIVSEGRKNTSNSSSISEEMISEDKSSAVSSARREVFSISDLKLVT